VNFSRARDFSEIILQKHGSDCENSGLWVDYPKVHGPFCKIFKFNQNNELFM
jgi:hypothetical protein